MRVLVVDQDSASNLAITRSLKDLYSVDCVTNKADCLDLLRSNTFEVIVATERLEDGSGLELLGQISKKWPSVVRIFAADRQRLQLLRGRLGPFELFQTLTYPMVPERLIATLALAEAAQNADADTSDIQHVELSGEAPAEASAEAAEFEDSFESEEAEDFPAPRPAARVAPMEQAHAASRGGRAAGRSVSAHQSHSTPGQRPRGNGAAGAPTTRAAPGSSVGRGVASGASGARGMGPGTRGAGSGASGAQGTGSGARGAGSGASGAQGTGSGARGAGSGSSGARSTASAASGARGAAPSALGARDSPPAPTFPGSGTLGPRGAPASSAGVSRHGRSRGATNKAPPVRFPPLERTPPLERIPPLEPPEESSGRRGDSFTEAAAMARAARSNYESTSEESDTKRLAMMIGGGLAVALAVVFLGVEIFGSKSDAPQPAVSTVAHAPEYPQEVTDLVAQTEAAFKTDDFKGARADVDKLRQISPSHPRLEFFEGLLISRADGAKGGTANASASRGASKKNGKSSAATTSPASTTSVTPSKAVTGPATGPDTASSSASSATASTQDGPALAPETPVGFSRATAASNQSQGAETARSKGEAAPAEAAGGSASAPMAGAAAPGATSTSASGAVTSGAISAPDSGGPVLGTAPPGAAGPSGSALALASAATPNTAPAAASAPTASEAMHTQGATSSPTHRGSGEPPPVIQEAKLIRRVNPDYPSAAKKDGIAGSVDLEVTVSAQGVVEDASVIQATPPDMFEKSALAAVRKWKYDPRFVDGLPSLAHLKVHLDFGPNR